MISSIRQMLAHGAPASFSRFSQVLASALASASSMIARSAGFVLLALEPVGEARIVQHVGAADRRHQRVVLPVVVHREQQKAVLGAEQVGGDLAADRLVAELLLPVAGDGEVGDLGGEERQARLQHRHVDELALAGMRALEQRR